ncbi:MAG: hypothetical protein ISS23_03090 [Nanoarchaeota archaeon]|nr:hypothetical protein [Nanoarchaeota archaeon]
MLNFLKKLFGFGKKPGKGSCSSCGGTLIRAKSDVIETYGKPVMVCSKCKKLVEI